jgi:hypothetical protein
VQLLWFRLISNLRRQGVMVPNNLSPQIEASHAEYTHDNSGNEQNVSQSDWVCQFEFKTLNGPRFFLQIAFRKVEMGSPATLI